MNPTVKSFFINPALQQVRAGWRMAMLLLVMIGGNIVITGPVVAFLQAKGWMNNALAMVFVYGVTTGATWIMLRFVDKRPFAAVGIPFNRSTVRELGQGLLFGGVMMSGIFAIESAAGLVHLEYRVLTFGEQAGIFANAAFLYIVVGYGEEFLFRGYLFQSFVEGTNKWIATLALSLLFAVAHSKNPNVSLFGLINVGLAGIWLAIGYFKTRALWLSIGMHISWNFAQGFVYGYPVSGTTSDKEQIVHAIVTGPDWLTGGTFGPEGGALATGMLVLCSAGIILWKWVRPAETAWSLEQWRAEKKAQKDVAAQAAIAETPAAV